jgi:thioredoxin-related protein
MDQSSLFMSHQVCEFAESLKKIEENPKRWHEVLSEALWAYCISKHSTIKETHFELVYEREAVLPVEVNLVAF